MTAETSSETRVTLCMKRNTLAMKTVSLTLALLLASALAAASSSVPAGPLIVDAHSHIVVMEYEAWFGPKAVTFQTSAAMPLLQSPDMQRVRRRLRQRPARRDPAACRPDGIHGHRRRDRRLDQQRELYLQQRVVHQEICPVLHALLPLLQPNHPRQHRQSFSGMDKAGHSTQTHSPVGRHRRPCVVQGSRR